MRARLPILPRALAARGEPLTPAPAIDVRGVSKVFRLPQEPYSTFKDRLSHPLVPRAHEELRAVTDVSFSVQPGEFFGIVGRNGSGKSTLLKMIAGIYTPDSGAVAVRGRVAPFIELGVGFTPALAARDNVLINSVLLGLTSREAQRRFPEIMAFAELEEFVDLKLMNYSSGMSARLGFSVSVQVDADVLLLDEVLAVGDAAFKEKCFAEFERLKAEGRTIVFVTHDMGAIEEFCDRALVLDRGRPVELADAARAAEVYRSLNQDAVEQAARRPHAPTRPAARPRDGSSPLGRSSRWSGRIAALGRFTSLVSVMAKTDVKLHYAGSAFGYAWSLLHPLMLFGVYYFVFTQVVHFGGDIAHYGVNLLTSIVLWTFLAEATTRALPSLVSRSGMLRKIRFPSMVVPLAAVVTAGFNLFMNLLAVLVFALASGMRPQASWLELPLLLVALAALATGLALLLSVVYVRFRDLALVWTVVMRAGFYGTPVLYIVSRFPDAVAHVLSLNPVAAILTQMRHAFIDPRTPDAAAAAGGTGHLVVPAAATVLVLVAGITLFRREASRIVESL